MNCYTYLAASIGSKIMIISMKIGKIKMKSENNSKLIETVYFEIFFQLLNASEKNEFLEAFYQKLIA